MNMTKVIILRGRRRITLTETISDEISESAGLPLDLVEQVKEYAAGQRLNLIDTTWGLT